MLTWTEVRAHVGCVWSLAVDAPAWCAIVLDLGGARHKVALQPVADPPRLVVVAHVCARRHLGPLDALRYNAAAEHGMLTIEGPAYVLRQLLRLERLDTEDVDGVIRAMATEAARLRRALVRPAAPLRLQSDVYAFMAD